MTSDYLSIPLYQNRYFIKGSICPTCLTNMVNLLNQDLDFRQKVLDQKNYPLYLKTYYHTFQDMDNPNNFYTFNDLLSPNLEKQIGTIPEILPEVKEEILRKIPEFYNLDQSKLVSGKEGVTLSKPAFQLDVLPSPVIVHGGTGSETQKSYFMLKLIAILLISVVSLYYLDQVREIKVIGEDDDKRRIVLGIYIPETQFRFCLKYTLNEYYFASYRIEADIYRFFSQELSISQEGKDRELLDKIVKYYGSADKQTEGEYLNISYQDPNKTGYQTKRINIANYYQHPDGPLFTPGARRAGFYMCTEWISHGFSELRNLGRAFPLSPTSSKIPDLFLLIVTTLGKLNQSYGFYHGDLHDNNIFVRETHSEIKFFDFDFSGIIQRRYLNFAAFETYSYIKRDNMKIIGGSFGNQPEKWRDFLYFFDVYRIYLSILIKFYYFDSGSPLHDIQATNNSMTFKISKIYDVLTTIAYATDLNNSDVLNRVAKFLKKISDKSSDVEDFNALFRLDFVYVLYYHVCPNSHFPINVSDLGYRIASLSEKLRQ